MKRAHALCRPTALQPTTITDAATALFGLNGRLKLQFVFPSESLLGPVSPNQTHRSKLVMTFASNLFVRAPISVVCSSAQWLKAAYVSATEIIIE